MVVATVSEWWDRYGDQTKLDKINEIINAINTNISGVSTNVSGISTNVTAILARLTRDPDFDSLWFTLAVGATINKAHGRGTRNLWVHIIGENTSSIWHQISRGGNFGLISTHPHERYGGVVQEITTTNIKLKRQPEDWTGWVKFRVLAWELA